MSFHTLTEEQYQNASNSLCFPHLTAAMLERYLTIGREQGSTAMLQTVKQELHNQKQ